MPGGEERARRLGSARSIREMSASSVVLLGSWRAAEVYEEALERGAHQQGEGRIE